LGLGPTELPVNECAATFDKFAEKAFTPHVLEKIPWIGRKLGYVVQEINYGQYMTEPLEEALREAFPKDRPLFGGSYRSRKAHVKVAVTTTTKEGRVVVLSNYNRKPPQICEQEPFLCDRPIQPTYATSSLISIPPTQAKQGDDVVGGVSRARFIPDSMSCQLTASRARATSAAPTYYRPFSHEISELVLLDGGLYHNNPIKVADAESKAIWPESRHRHPDIILSIGTGFERSEMTIDDAKVIAEDVAVSEHPDPPKSLKLNPYSYPKLLLGMQYDHVLNSLPCERTWHEWLGTRAPDRRNERRYRRLTIELEEPIEMDDVKKMQDCRNAVEKWAQNNDLTSIAYQLLSSCFYYSFQPGEIQETWDEKYICFGNVVPSLSN
jgi:hypothetical protein